MEDYTEKPPPADGNAKPRLVTIVAAPVAAATSTDDDYKCKICSAKFKTLQECLKHELLEHSMSKKHKRPQKTLRNKLNSILRTLSDDDTKTLRTQIRTALSKCAPGEELPTLFKFYRMNVENLELVYTRIHTCLEKELSVLGSGSLKIFPFGSIASGLALKESDIDLYIEIKNQHDTGTVNGHHRQRNSHPHQIRGSYYNKVNNLLHRSTCFDEVFAIRNARVPIIKCKHKPTGFSLDINLSCPSSVHNTNFLRDLVACDGRLHELLLFLKVWASQLQLIGSGHMSSYCLITLVLFYLQQKWEKSSQPLVPSIQQLQTGETPNLIMGVNYAYNLSAHLQPLPPTLTVLMLIRGFFAFYRQFEFEKKLIAPHLGHTLLLEDFKSGACKYTAYENQIRAMTIMVGEPANELQAERCMCVQDPFALNHNVAKSISPPNLDYFRTCLQHAHRICSEEVYSDADLYENLLYGIIERIAHAAELEQQVVGQSTSTASGNSTGGPHTLTYSFTPCRAEMRALAAHTAFTEIAGAGDRPLHRLWVRNYSDAIIEIITEVYRLDMQSASPTHRDKHQRLENADRTRTWLLSGSVDMWTGRLHQRSATQTFMAYQREQSKTMAYERRQNAAYAVQLNGVLTLSIVGEYAGLELRIMHRESTNLLCKKDPLRKFFTMFKSSMQNFNLKERLQEISATKPPST